MNCNYDINFQNANRDIVCFLSTSIDMKEGSEISFDLNKLNIIKVNSCNKKICTCVNGYIYDIQSNHPVHISRILCKLKDYEIIIPKGSKYLIGWDSKIITNKFIIKNKIKSFFIR